MKDKLENFNTLLERYGREIRHAYVGQYSDCIQNKIDEARLDLIKEYAEALHPLWVINPLLIDVPPNCTAVIDGNGIRIEQQGFGQFMPPGRPNYSAGVMPSSVSPATLYHTEPDVSRAAYDARKAAVQSGIMDDDCRHRSCKDD